MKTTVLVLILGAVSTGAYFSGRIYLLLAAQHAQAIEMETRQQEFLSNVPHPMPRPTFENRGLR